ncbi:MAG: hypothetical protein ACREBU_09585 [Nitrososphaera sp.]
METLRIEAEDVVGTHAITGLGYGGATRGPGCRSGLSRQPRIHEVLSYGDVLPKGSVALKVY